MLFYIILAVLVGHITCGPRIIGGRFAKAGSFPYQVSLQLNGEHFCGGSIISETFIITAAHCTFRVNPSKIKVVVGTIDLLAGDGKSFDIAEVIMHREYDSETDDYDISLIRLSNALPLGTSTLNKIEMVSAETNVPANTMVVVSGFGFINGDEESTDKLKYAVVPMWGSEHCNPRHVNGITDRMICAGNPSGQESSCEGDSGGPLTLDNKLLGIVSWGFGCGEKGPAIYTSVAALRTWIKEHSGV